MTYLKDNDKNLTITRIFNAPRERVWQSWTDAEKYSCWCGPTDFTAPYTHIDLRVGGKYLICMRSPEGKDYWSTGFYTEISEPAHLSCTDSFADEHGNIVPAAYYGAGEDIPQEMQVDVTLEDLGGKTKLILKHCCFPDSEMRTMTATGWRQSLDKLAECLG